MIQYLCFQFFWEKLKTCVEYWKVVLQLLVIPITGLIITIVISNSQQKLSTIQIFNDKLMGDRIRRDATIKVIKQLGDKELADKLIAISDSVTIEMLKFDIWSDSVRVREDAIQEYAKLYCKYPLEVLDALMPRRYHLQSGKVVISIAKFFYYLAIYDTCNGGKWKGTESDSIQFAKITTTEFYKDTINYKNLHKFMDTCLTHFEERDTTYPPKYINLYENNKPDNMMDDSVMTKSYTVILSEEGKRNLNAETLKELRDGRFFMCSKIDDQGSFFYMEISLKNVPYKKLELFVPSSYIKFFYSSSYYR
jgi:hypothetical protein